MSKFFKALKESLEEAVAHKKGKLHLRSEVIRIPEPPTVYTASDVKNIRERHNYSQGVFARILNVSEKTLQSWEAGRRNPSHSALRLLEIIDKGIYKPDILQKRK